MRNDRSWPSRLIMNVSLGEGIECMPACLNAHCEKKSRRSLARVTGFASSFDAGLNSIICTHRPPIAGSSS